MGNRENPIRLFEYDKLIVTEEAGGFNDRHWRALSRYNEEYGNRFFTTLHNGVKFKEYVGVLQVENLTIEILPKVDRSDPNVDTWQAILLEMLRECKWMQVHAHQEASLRLKHNSILDAYLEVYLNSCVRLLYEGLVKKYRQQEGNLYALKGKLKFSGHISRNIVHQERFYTEHSIYNQDNIFNRILLKALRTIPRFTNSPLLKDKLGRLLLDFPDLPDMEVRAKTFQNLVYDRKTERYKSAMEIAAMLLLNYRPDVRGGRNHVLAILFDMNELWEEYFYRRLRHSLPEGWTIEAQARKVFWEMTDKNVHKNIKPDVVIRIPGEKEKVVIIDTKWKMPGNDIPSDADLRQVFVYNKYWGAGLGILVYPQPEQEKAFEWLEGCYINERSRCVVSKINVLNEEKQLRRDLTQPFIKMIGVKVQIYESSPAR